MKGKIVIFVFLIITSCFVFAQTASIAKRVEQEVRQAIAQLNDVTTTGDMVKTRSLIAAFTLLINHPLQKKCG